MRKFYFEYLIDDKPLLVPDAGVEISQTDIDAEDSGRDESGFMHRQRLREWVKTWSFVYATLTREEYRYLEHLFAGKAEFTFQYRDLDGQPRSCRAYCSKNSITLHNVKLGIYKNYKFNIIEC